MQPVDRKIKMFLSINTHMHTNTSNIKLLYIISWKHHTHKVNAIHAYVSFHSFNPCCQVLWDENPHLTSAFTPCCQVPWDVNPHLISSFTPCYQVPWDVNPNPHLIIVCPCYSCFMFHAHTQLVYYYFHAHALNTYFQYKTRNNSTHQFIN
jgi:hypothetical protein